MVNALQPNLGARLNRMKKKAPVDNSKLAVPISEFYQNEC